jgi:serine/threonine protein kinase
MGLEIGKTVDGYEIVEVLGSSKTGVAYKVRNVFAQRFEVLKILPKSVQDDEEQNARFLREIKVHAQLLHPNIVTFYNARQMEGQLVMTTEFVPGVTVADRLEAGPIAWRDACHFACEVLSALAYAHAHGIVHRGLSSSNLILTPEGSIRLTGFGLAKSVADPDLTAAGSVIGALKYMAPEQVKGEGIDARSDLYALGIVLHEMLTGKLPFAAKGQFEIMLAHVNTAPKHASDVNAEVPRELGDVIARALAKSPDDRFPNAQEFREAIECISVKSETTPEAPTPAPSVTSERVNHEPPESIVELQPAPAQLERLQPAVEGATFLDTPAPASSSETWDAWSFDPPAESKPVLEPEPALSVSELATFSESSRTALIEPSTEPAEPVSVAEVSAFSETPAPVSTNVLWDAHAIEAALLSAQAKVLPAESEPSAELPPAPSALEPAAPVVTIAESAEIAAPATSSFLWDSWAINSDPAPVESEPAPSALQLVQPPVEAEAATPIETPAPVSSATLWDAWAVESALASAESHLTPLELQPASSEATFHDSWATESSAPLVESAPVEAEFATPVPVVTAVADASAAPSLFGNWMSDYEPAPPNPEPSELKLLSAALETPPPPAEQSADMPASDWPSKVPDFWVLEPAHSSAESQSESTGLELLSAALDPPAVPVEAPPPVPASALEEPSAIDSEPPAVDLPAPSPELEPALVPALATAPDPVVKAVPSPNPDLLTALFGDTLLSRLSLALVVCAITFLLGTVTLFAVLSVSKP